jgi:cytoskeletal protein CcmA (bactofilin family)
MRLMLFLTVLFFSLAARVHCEETENSTPTSADEVVAVRAGEIYKGDFFGLGDSIEISGIVEGDVYLLGSQIMIDGIVQGDVIAIGGSVDVAGKVMGNVRILAGQVTIGGEVTRNTTLIAANAQMPFSGDVGGNVIILAGNSDLAATIGGNAMAVASNLRVSSNIQKNLEVYVGQMRITSKARIHGDLSYRSNEVASIDPSARVFGKIVYHPSLFHNMLDMPILRGVIIGSKIAGILMNFLYTFVIGIIFIRMFPRKLESTLHTLQEKPVKSLGFGLVLLILLPLVSLLLLMTVLGAPFALTLIALNIISFYTAKVFSILWASNWLFSKIGWKRNKIPTLAFGQVIYYILTTIPFLGFFIAFFSMLFGLGAAVLAQTKQGGIFHHQN